MSDGYRIANGQAYIGRAKENGGALTNIFPSAHDITSDNISLYTLCIQALEKFKQAHPELDFSQAKIS